MEKVLTLILCIGLLLGVTVNVSWADSATVEVAAGGLSTRYEAETGIVKNCEVRSSTNASNGQYVGGINAISDSCVLFNVNVEADGTYALTIYYANGFTYVATHDITINDEFFSTITYQPTSGWAMFDKTAVNIKLKAGANTIKLSKGSEGYAELDCIELEQAASTLKGDANGDEAVDSIDYALLKSYLLNSNIKIILKNMDINEDSEINAIDFAMMKLLILKQAEPGEPSESIGVNIRLETAVTSGQFLRVSNGKLSFSKNVSPLTDSKFIESEGLSGNNTVSFESLTQRGYYICRQSGSNSIILLKNDGSIDFKNNASFNKVTGLSKGYSYELYNSKGTYIKNENGGLVAGTSASDTDRLKASFLVRSEANTMLSDEFNGNSLNTNIWAYNYPWADHHNYSAIARASQVSVSDGKLILKATRVAADNWIKDDKGETGYTDNIGEKVWRKYSHLTGVVHLPFSKYKLSGNLYIEGSFKMPNKSGFWPAFWLNGNNGWPPEIDIFEYLSNTPEKIYVGIHRFDSSKSNNDGGQGWWINKTPEFFQQQFHKYAIDWGETYINYYIDDVLVRSVEDRAVIDNQKDMYMIINLGVGGWATEPTDNVGDNTTYECDYIHVYKY